MGWETRRNGRRYYYEKVRTPDGRVVSRYYGNGMLAECVAVLNEHARIKREHQRTVERGKRAQLEEVTRISKEVEDWARLLTHASLLATGHHTHKGQWRRRRRRADDAC